MDLVEHSPLSELMHSNIFVPDWWTSTEEQIQAFLNNEIHIGRVETIASSPGGRPIQVVIYGEVQSDDRPTANFNSAIAARNRPAFCRRENRLPVLMVLAGTHGAEVEGMVGSLSLIRILETGRDLRGAPQEALKAALSELRCIIIPCANPDGRARVPYDGFVGLPTEEMTKVNQGTRKDGSLWGWPGCKQAHPMQGDVSFLGGYFDDAGINLMHDEWWNPMSPVTAPLLALSQREAPDLLLNLHSHANPPAVLRAAYVPMHVKKKIEDLGAAFNSRIGDHGLTPGPVPGVNQDGETPEQEPPFNLTSALYHSGTALPVTVEFPHGFNDKPVEFDYDQILESLHILFAVSAEILRSESP